MRIAWKKKGDIKDYEIYLVVKFKLLWIYSYSKKQNKKWTSEVNVFAVDKPHNIQIFPVFLGIIWGEITGFSATFNQCFKKII